MSDKVISEAYLTTKVTAHLKSLNHCWFFKVWGGGAQRRGIPDIVGVYFGRFFALELKASNGKPSALQTRAIRLITEAGGYARVVYPNDWEQIKKELEMITYGVI